jgi:hypothetical protein
MKMLVKIDAFCEDFCEIAKYICTVLYIPIGGIQQSEGEKGGGMWGGGGGKAFSAETWANAMASF